MAEEEKNNTGQGQDTGANDAAAGQAGKGKAAAAAETGKPKSSKSKKPKVISRARYVGNSPLKVKQGDYHAVMLWPNQVYKNLVETDDVAFLIKKRMLKKIK